jgi:hypothetical protein
VFLLAATLLHPAAHAIKVDPCDGHAPHGHMHVSVAEHPACPLCQTLVLGYANAQPPTVTATDLAAGAASPVAPLRLREAHHDSDRTRGPPN